MFVCFYCVVQHGCAKAQKQDNLVFVLVSLVVCGFVFSAFDGVFVFSFRWWVYFGFWQTTFTWFFGLPFGNIAHP